MSPPNPREHRGLKAAASTKISPPPKTPHDLSHAAADAMVAGAGALTLTAGGAASGGSGSRLRRGGGGLMSSAGGAGSMLRGGGGGVAPDGGSTTANPAANPAMTTGEAPPARLRATGTRGVRPLPLAPWQQRRRQRRAGSGSVVVVVVSAAAATAAVALVHGGGCGGAPGAAAQRQRARRVHQGAAAEWRVARRPERRRHGLGRHRNASAGWRWWWLGGRGRRQRPLFRAPVRARGEPTWQRCNLARTLPPAPSQEAPHRSRATEVQERIRSRMLASPQEDGARGGGEDEEEEAMGGGYCWDEEDDGNRAAGNAMVTTHGSLLGDDQNDSEEQAMLDVIATSPREGAAAEVRAACPVTALNY